MSEEKTQPRPHSRRLLVIVIIILLIAIAFGLWYYTASRPWPAPVARRNIESFLTAEGTIIAPPSAQAEVMTGYSAPVEKVYATVGQKVKQGEILVELYLPSTEEAQAQAKLQVQALENYYATAKSNYESRISAAKSQLSQAKAALDQARAGAETAAASQTTGATPGTIPVENAPEQLSPEENLQQAQTAVQQAEQYLAQLQAGREASLAPYQQQAEISRQALAEANAGAREAYIRAPISGTVLALNAQPGKPAGAEESRLVATIVDLDKLQAEAVIGADQVSSVKVDLPATITLKDNPNTPLQGSVLQVTTRVASKVGDLIKQQQYLALIKFENTEGSAKPQMQANIAIKLGEVKEVLAVPNEAIGKDESGRPIVEVLKNRQWQPVVVETGLKGEAFTEIKSGLKEGDLVQVTPSPVKALSQSKEKLP